MGKQVFAIVLAAGSARRFGSPKQLAALDGRALVERAVDAAAAACGDRLAVVVGHDSASVARVLQGLPGFVVANDSYSSGMGTSIAAAVQAVRHAAEAVLITLADQPLVTGAHLASLVAAWSGASDEIVATGFAGTSGPPVLFPSACFDELERLAGDRGPRPLLSDARFRTTIVDFEPAGVDIDTADDLASLRGV